MHEIHKIEKLINKYIELAIIQKETMHEGRKVADKMVVKLEKLYKKLVLLNFDAEIRLEKLLTHEHPAVRWWAANHVHNFAPKKAEEALEDMKNGDDAFYNLEAEILLDFWKK